MSDIEEQIIGEGSGETTVAPAAQTVPEADSSIKDVLSQLLIITKNLAGQSSSSSDISATNASNATEEVDESSDHGEELWLDEDETETEVGDPVAESVKKLVEQRSTALVDEHVFTAKMKKSKRPSNVDLFTPKVNPEIWRSMQAISKQKDKR